MIDQTTLSQRLKQLLAQRKKETLILTDAPLAPAAVLLPLYQRAGEDWILFTKRTDKVEHHKGQISFPGGARSEGDRDLLETALRETFEEIGVRPQDVEVLGELDDMSTPTSQFMITPFVGVIPYPYDFTISRYEIEELIEVPLAALMDERNHREEVYIIEGVSYKGNIFEYNGEVIWGATARILKQLLDLAFGE